MVRTLEMALKDFSPGPQKRVIIWIHAHPKNKQDGEHWVGEMENSDLSENECQLVIRCKWTIRVEPTKQENISRWRVVPGSRTENPITIDWPTMRSVNHDKIEVFEQDGDTVNMYISADRVIEADELLKQYS